LAMAERDLFYVTEDEAGLGGVELLRAGNSRIALLIPLLDNDEVHGVLAVHYADLETVHRIDPGVALAIGRQCGLAIGRQTHLARMKSAYGQVLAGLDQLPEGVVMLGGPEGRVIALNRE